jgi:hypothetical protein
VRAHTKGKNEIGKRFATVIGVAAAGVMALGAQTALAGGEPGGITPPHVQLSAPKKQEFGKAVKVKASCGDEACTAYAQGQLHWVRVREGRRNVGLGGGWLKDTSADLEPGETTTLKLKLKKKMRREAGKALDEGKEVHAKISAATAPDRPDHQGHDDNLEIELVKHLK